MKAIDELKKKTIIKFNKKASQSQSNLKKSLH